MNQILNPGTRFSGQQVHLLEGAAGTRPGFGVRSTGLPPLIYDRVKATVSTGWTLLGLRSWEMGELVWFRLHVTIDGPDLTANAVGQFVDTTIATIDSHVSAVGEVDSTFQTGYTSGGCTLFTDQTLKLRDAHSGSSISAGQNLVLSMGPYPFLQ